MGGRCFTGDLTPILAEPQSVPRIDSKIRGPLSPLMVAGGRTLDEGRDFWMMVLLHRRSSVMPFRLYVLRKIAQRLLAGRKPLVAARIATVLWLATASVFASQAP